jgi:hypothetical protein
VRWTDWATGEPLPGAVQGAVTNSKGAVQGAVDETKLSSQPTDDKNTSNGEAPASLISLSQSAFGAFNLTKSKPPDSRLNNPQLMVAEKTLGDGDVEEEAKADDETILQHFGGQWGVLALTIEEIGAGRMVKEIWSETIDYDLQRDLLKLCGEAISEFGAQPYLGLQTNAFIMDLAAKRYTAKGKEWPKCWLKVLNDLKRADNTALGTTR